MPTLTFTVEPCLSGVRVDTFLSRQLRNYTTWRLLRMVEAGLVTINDLPATSAHRVFSRQTVCVRLCEPPDKLLDADRQALQIIWEDPWLLVLDKPAGVVAHPVGEFQEATLGNAVQAHLDQQTVARGLLRPGIVHRLDRMTSGLIVLTKHHLAHRRLSLDIQQGLPRKRYLAIVEGRVRFESRQIRLPIGQHPHGGSVLMSTSPDARRPRAAATDVRVLSRHETFSLIECDLLTGRNHQIRVHMAALGHPVLGDEFYLPHGDVRPLRVPDSSPPAAPPPASRQRHALHASFLQFQHPVLQLPLEFRSVPPEDFWDLTSDERPPSPDRVYPAG